MYFKLLQCSPLNCNKI